MRNCQIFEVGCRRKCSSNPYPLLILGLPSPSVHTCGPTFLQGGGVAEVNRNPKRSRSRLVGNSAACRFAAQDFEQLHLRLYRPMPLENGNLGACCGCFWKCPSTLPSLSIRPAEEEISGFFFPFSTISCISFSWLIVINRAA